MKLNYGSNSGMVWIKKIIVSLNGIITSQANNILRRAKHVM